MFHKKKILVGITGGIAAYKAADLVSALRKNGANVHVLMTQNAKKFVSPMTFRSLSHNPVISKMFSKGQEKFPHLNLAESADLLIIVPATANFIGKVANGVADDVLSTTFISVQCPVLIAPAMNTAMYQNKLVQNNIKRLKKAGTIFIPPKNGILACGKKGAGKLAEIPTLIKVIQKSLKVDLKKLPLKNRAVLITSGGTREALDPVRYISNASSGKMGKALADTAKKMGAQVTLLDARTSVAKLKRALFKHYKNVDAVIMAAAVSDYRPKYIKKHKIKSKDNKLIIELERSPDLLEELGRKKQKQKLIGFCLESKDLVQNARQKLKKKNLDLIIANTPAALGAEDNKATFIYPNGKIKRLKKMPKIKLAELILGEVCRSFNK
ncbi:bifunctional phosphopantothenoylcysteine decarboxylase/phosphopantothenate--cysteine ligase CoaBC [Candidatus Margulisiibacteriota bacterium]